MSIKTITEAKAQLSALIEEVRKGNVIIIGKAGRPVAKLVPYDGSATPRVGGALRGAIRISADFDDFTPELDKLFTVGS